MKNLNRRKFLKKSSLSAASLYMASNLACSQESENRPSEGTYMGDFAAPKLDTVRIAIIGVGARGSGHAKQLAAIEGTEIVAISAREASKAFAFDAASPSPLFKVTFCTLGT